MRDVELQIDMETGMKNYIANGKGDWATSAAFVKYSFERSIHHGRLYSNGSGFFKGKDEDLAEALRCLGQGLHTLEDFGAHTNYVELSLIELGLRNVFPHVGEAAGINLHGKQVFPLVTGTFGMVDFYHSVLGEATDHFTQSEVNEMDNALGTAQQAAKSSNPLFTLVKLLSKVPGTRELCDEAEQLQASSQAQARAMEQPFGEKGGFRDMDNHGGSARGMNDWESNRAGQEGFPPQHQGYDTNSWDASQQGYQQPRQDWGQQQHQPQWQDQAPQGFRAQDQGPGVQHDWQNQQQPPSQQWGQQAQPQQWDQQHQQPSQAQQAPQSTAPGQMAQSQAAVPSGLPEMPNFDPAKTAAQIYPILAFRDKVVRSISAIIEKIPGLEKLVDRIVETLTVFILSLLAPFVRPVIKGISKTLQTGSAGVIDSSGKHQYEVWINPHSSDPTHSMLSKDHFSNILNEPAGYVAAEIVKFIAPRVLFAWEYPDVPIDQVMRDVESIFHHPAIRNERVEVQRNMFAAVRKWMDGVRDRGLLETVLSSNGVRAGKNHKDGNNPHLQSHQQQAPSGGQHSSMGGLGGLASFLPGQHQGGGGGQGSSPFGMVGNVIGNFTGQGSHQKPAQHQGGTGAGGLNDMLHMADKLHIPGAHNVSNLSNKYSKYSKYMGGFGGGGSRGIDDDGEPFQGSEMGGSRELQEAAAVGDQTGEGLKSPSPLPMQPPPGYEQYGRQDVGSYAYGQGEQEPQYQTSYQDPYQGQGQGQGYGQGHGQGQYGGESSGYYGGQ